jgi:hypothetical protein
MSFPAFLGFLAGGAAVLAGWFAVRFPELAPSAFRTAVLHFGVALGLVWAGPNLVESLAGGAVTQALMAVFLLVLPALIYGCLAAVWVLTLYHEAIRR